MAAAVSLLVLCGCGHLVILHDPLGAPEHNDLGVAYERAGRSEAAAREYRRALRTDSRFARARVNLGNLAAGAGRLAEAERCYRRALADAPGDADARNNLAYVVARRGGDLDEAEWLARSAVALGAPDDTTYQATLREVLALRRRSP